MRESLSQLSIIIPTKDRAPILTELLESLRRLDDIGRIRPEIIVADNDSRDDTYNFAAAITTNFPTTIRVLKVARPGKSAALNDAVKAASGSVLAFLDDDVVVNKTWLSAVERFFGESKYQAGQGLIRLQSPANDDPEIMRLVRRYGTIPYLEQKPNAISRHSLNGANFFVSRAAFDRAGGFDERLGPGASGTSEDVDFARRLIRAQITIGYAPQAIVYHRVDPSRLSDAYFEQRNRRQGASRLLMKDRCVFEILSNLGYAYLRYYFYSLLGNELRGYQNLARVFHYREMVKAKRHGAQKLA
jgi:glycosyltransferase involved in cell wall biosynthesis